MSRPFGVGGRTRRKTHAYVEEVPRLCVYDLPKVAGAPLGPLARDGVDTVDTLGAVASTIRVVVNGKPETIETVSDPRHLGGAQRYFLCACGRRVWHLYYVRADERAAERLVCRRCAGPLGYRSKHTRQRGLNRARRLREKIGALPSPLAPLPPKPKFWRQDYWTQAVARTAVAEAALAAQLHAMVVRVRRRRLRHEHSNRDARRT